MIQKHVHTHTLCVHTPTNVNTKQFIPPGQDFLPVVKGLNHVWYASWQNTWQQWSAAFHLKPPHLQTTGYVFGCLFKQIRSLSIQYSKQHFLFLPGIIWQHVDGDKVDCKPTLPSVKGFPYVWCSSVNHMHPRFISVIMITSGSVGDFLIVMSDISTFVKKHPSGKPVN